MLVCRSMKLLFVEYDITVYIMILIICFNISDDDRVDTIKESLPAPEELKDLKVFPADFEKVWE